MLYYTCTTLTSVDLAHYGVYRAKDLVSVDCGTNNFTLPKPNISTKNRGNMCTLNHSCIT